MNAECCGSARRRGFGVSPVSLKSPSPSLSPSAASACVSGYANGAGAIGTSSSSVLASCSIDVVRSIASSPPSPEAGGREGSRSDSLATPAAADSAGEGSFKFSAECSEFGPLRTECSEPLVPVTLIIMGVTIFREC